MDSVTARLQRRYLVRHTHHGIVLDFPRPPPSALEVAFAVFGWVVVGWLSLVLLALPVAALVEHLGWWLVNEQVLQTRWMMIGLGVWPLLAVPLGLALRGSSTLRVQIDQYGMTWRRWIGSRRIAWAALRSVGVHRGRLWLFRHDQRVMRMPTLQIANPLSIAEPSALQDLAALVESCRTARELGTREDVPEEMRSLVAASPMASSVPPPG